MSITCVHVPLKKKKKARKGGREEKKYKEIQSIIVIFRFLLR